MMMIYILKPYFLYSSSFRSKIKIPSLKGELELEIPRNAKDKQQFTFKNEGVKKCSRIWKR